MTRMQDIYTRFLCYGCCTYTGARHHAHQKGMGLDGGSDCSLFLGRGGCMYECMGNMASLNVLAVSSALDHFGAT